MTKHILKFNIVNNFFSCYQDVNWIHNTDTDEWIYMFRYFNSAQAIGLVENQSDWYIPGTLRSQSTYI